MCSPEYNEVSAKVSEAHHPLGSSFAASWKWALAVVVASPLNCAFATWFPFVIPYTKAFQYYVEARYEYKEGETHFDNSPLTYVTDYLLFIAMASAAYDMYKLSTLKTSCYHLKNICRATCGLLTCYATSVLCGGLSHQFFTSVALLNTWAFRFLWIMCVGTVTAASGFIGAVGSYIALHFRQQQQRKRDKDIGLKRQGSAIMDILIAPTYFWVLFALYLTLACVCGEMSFHRPACDIFVAGTGQFPPTFYLLLMLLTSPSKGAVISKGLRAMFLIAFLLNSWLLPAYPELLETGLPEGYVNFLLHTNLFVAWGLQYVAIKELCVTQMSLSASS
jgi:hypothetical protein